MQSTDSVKLEIEDGKWSEFVDDSYLLPLKITSVSNAKLSGEHSSAYIVVNSSYSNCVAGATSVEGALISDRSAWTATLDGVDTGKNLFDGNTRTYNRGNVMVVDLQSEVEAISGFKMTFYSQSYCLSYVTVYTSNDGENYECQGAVNVARSASQYIRFYGSISARYIKLELSPYNSTRGVRFAEFDVYQNK